MLAREPLFFEWIRNEREIRAGAGRPTGKSRVANLGRENGAGDELCQENFSNIVPKIVGNSEAASTCSGTNAHHIGKDIGYGADHGGIA